MQLWWRSGLWNPSCSYTACSGSADLSPLPIRFPANGLGKLWRNGPRSLAPTLTWQTWRKALNASFGLAQLSCCRQLENDWVDERFSLFLSLSGSPSSKMKKDLSSRKVRIIVNIFSKLYLEASLLLFPCNYVVCFFKPQQNALLSTFLVMLKHHFHNMISFLNTLLYYSIKFP